MAWLTPEEFEMAKAIKAENGRAGFGSLLCAAAVVAWVNGDFPQLFEEIWQISKLHPFDRKTGLEIAYQYLDQPLVVLMAAAGFKADLENGRKIDALFPGLMEELVIGRKVVEVENE